ncbi:hypothetical protein R3I94_002342 [Phoxinus phoxinus]
MQVLHKDQKLPDESGVRPSAQHRQRGRHVWHVYSNVCLTQSLVEIYSRSLIQSWPSQIRRHTKAFALFQNLICNIYKHSPKANPNAIQK